MPRKLAEDVKVKGRTRIFTLFQPASSNQRLFEVFLALVVRGDSNSGGLSFTYIGGPRTGDSHGACRSHLSAPRVFCSLF